MSSVPIDLDRERMRYLLEQLSVEMLDRNGAEELRSLLDKEARLAMDQRYKKTLLRLIEILDEYIRGKVNLMPDLNVRVSNVV
jgi:hypothetical protein